MSTTYLTKAIAACEAALKQGKDLEAACQTLGNVLQGMGRFEDAVVWHTRALDRQLDAGAVYASIGSLYTQQAQWQEAIVSYQQALQLSPQSAEICRSLASLYAQLGDTATEVDYRYRAVLLKPEWATPKNQLILGNSLLEQNKLEAAIDCYRRAVLLEPDYFDAQYNLAIALMESGQGQAARSAFEQALTLQPAHADAHYGLGKVLEQQGKWEMALSHYQQAIEINPNASGIHYACGDVLLHLRRWGEAVEAYQRAVTITPDFSWAYHRLGYALLRQGKLPEAIVAFQRAIELNPEFSWNHYHLGDAFTQQGKAEAALTAFRRALELQPDLAEAHTRIGNLLTDRGQPNEAMLLHRQALALRGWQQALDREYCFSRDWFSHNTPVLQQQLQPFVDAANLQVIEIGSFEGMSTCWLLDHVLTHPTAQITCIDPGFQPWFDRNLAQTGALQKLNKQIGNSHEILSTLKPNSYDFIYIDGCHWAEHVRLDGVLSWKLLKEGGLMIFDDYDWSDPDRPGEDTHLGIDAFLQTVTHESQIVHHGYQVILKKIKKTN